MAVRVGETANQNRKRRGALGCAFWIGALGLILSVILAVSHIWIRYALLVPFGDGYLSAWIIRGEFSVEWDLDPISAELVDDFDFGVWTVYWPLTSPYSSLASLNYRGFFGRFGAFALSIAWFVLVFAVVLAASLVLTRWQSRVKRLGVCESCGYDLTGNTSGRCPECGTRVSSTDVA